MKLARVVIALVILKTARRIAFALFPKDGGTK